MIKTAYRVVLALVLTGAVLMLLQLWFTVLSPETFIKVMITLGILLAVAGAVILIRKDTEEENSLKKDKFIN